MKIITIYLMLFACFTQAQKKYNVNSSYKESFELVNPISKEEASSAFKKIKEFKVPFKYPQGGCESRAYFMGMILDSLKVPNSRVWIFAKNQIDLNDLSTRLHIKDLRYPNKEIIWGYHTAPILLVKNNVAVDTMVIDPSLDEKGPLLLNDWFKKMGGFENALYSYVPNKYYNFYVPMKGNFYEYQGQCYDELRLEKNLAIDKVGDYIYFTYIKEKSKKYNPVMVENLIEMVFNINNFEKYIVSNELPDNFSERKLFSESPDFIIDCKNQYNRKLKYWCKRINSLSKYLQRI